MLALGSGVTAAAVAAGWAMPTAVGPGVAIGIAFGMKACAAKRQGPTLVEHRMAGGAMASNWVAVGIGLATSVVLLGALFAGVFLFQSSGEGTPYKVGNHDIVYYSGDATESDAAALGKALQADGCFKDRGGGMAVLLKKSAQSTLVSFVMQESAWNEPDTGTALTAIGHDIADTVGGSPFNVRTFSAPPFFVGRLFSHRLSPERSFRGRLSWGF